MVSVAVHGSLMSWLDGLHILFTYYRKYISSVYGYIALNVPDLLKLKQGWACLVSAREDFLTAV